ncbi:efflux RND transporter permease subunit [Paenibacillus gansuensis]|uniref:Efflux RND transporter permease subunit n=1 Tax=Paenibacillus gansuensis TaxID=306542 RepID=A0ABW5PFG9_9BACL
MQFLTRFSLKNSIAVLIISVLLIGLGAYSFSSLKSDLLPDIEFPQLSVTAVYPGASSEDVNEQITRKLEEKLKGIEGLDSMTSQSGDSVSRVQLSFPIGSDMDKITPSVNEAVKDAGLPEGVQTKVDRFSFGAIPIVNAALFAKDNPDFEAWVKETLKPELDKVKGINSVALSGLPEKYLEIIVDKTKARQYGLSLDAVKKAVQESYFSFPAGTVQDQTIVVPIRVDQKLTKLEDLKKVTVTSPVTGKEVALSGFAEVKTVEQTTAISRYNLKPSISLLINKKQDANTVEVADGVIEVLDKHKDKMEYVMSFDQAEGIKSSINELISKGLFGALFASLAVLIFLRNFRATIIAVLSIPLSLLIAAIFIKWWGLTLNVMSLAGMAVSVGRVVDDSIIVIENIFRKIKQDPAGDRSKLTMEGTKEMMSAILSSTITTVVVFLPLGLVGGITGAFFLPFALTIVVALLASLVVAITLIPILARSSFRKLGDDHEKEPFYVKWYEKLVRSALRHKVITVVLAFALLVGSFGLLAVSNLGFVFLPNEKQKLVQANIELPAATSLETTNDVSLQLEQLLDGAKQQYPKVFTSIGNYDYQTGTTSTNKATYFLELAEDVEMQDALKDVSSIIQGVLDAQAPGSIVKVSELSTGGPPTNNNVDVDLYSNNLTELEKASKQVEELMLKRTDIKNVKNNMQEKQLQWTVQLKPEQMKEKGLSSFMVLGLITDQTKPVSVGQYVLDGTEQDIRLSYDRPLSGKEELENLTLFGKAGPVKLKDVAEVVQGEVVTSIQKLNERVYARVSAEVAGNDVSGVTAQVISEVEKLDLPSGVSLEGGGGSDETAQTIQDLLVAMGIAIGLVYLTMLVFFGKARLPFVILTSLLFVPIGSLILLIIAKEPMSMSAMIGFLMLIGIVVTNAIVLVDRINQNRAAGLPIREAIIESGKTRLRPILMTALATIAALLPLAFSTPEGGLISRGLALVVVGGLTTSTLLTVVFLPVIYEIAFNREHRKEQKLAKSGGLSV